MLEQRSHSWVRNAYNMLFCALASVDANDAAVGAGKLNIKKPDEAVENGASPIAQERMGSMQDAGKGYAAGAGIATCGIVVGSGIDAESFEDFKLQTLIANGTGVGELSYIASEPYSISYAAPILSSELVRYFNNNTVGETDVDVDEVGLIVRAYVDQAMQSWYNSRDKLASPVVIPHTGQLRVTYTISLTYPS